MKTKIAASSGADGDCQNFFNGQWAPGSLTHATHCPLMKAWIVGDFQINPIRLFKILIFVFKFDFRNNDSCKTPLINIDAPDEPRMFNCVPSFLEQVLIANGLENSRGVSIGDVILKFCSRRSGARAFHGQ